MIQGLDCLGVTECLFDLQDVQTDVPVASGESITLTTGHPYWMLSIRVETPTRQAKAIWRNWHARQRAARKPFLASRSFSLIPRAGAISDTGLSVSGYNACASTVSLAGAGAWNAKIGDMISYYTAAGGYWLGEVQAPASASSGNIVVSVLPFPVAPHASLARPRRMYALAEFRLTGRAARTETHEPDYLEFEARQIIRIAGGQASPISPPASGVNLDITETLAL